MRARCVGAFARNLYGEIVFTGHDAAGTYVYLAGRQHGHIMEPVDRIHGESLEQAVVYHGPGAFPRFFGRLADEIHRAVEIYRMR